MRLVGENITTKYSDQELIDLLRDSVQNREAVGILYNQHKKYCIDYIRSKFKIDDSINDIYHDAIMVFYEKLNNPDFVLTCSIQTYINSICWNQVLNKFNKSKKYVSDTYDDNFKSLEGFEHPLEKYDDLNSERIRIIQSVLKDWSNQFKKCHEIIVRFWYKKQNMNEIAQRMNFAHADSAKSQKAKCQKEFKIEVYKRLISENNK